MALRPFQMELDPCGARHVRAALEDYAQKQVNEAKEIEKQHGGREQADQLVRDKLQLASEVRQTIGAIDLHDRSFWK